MATPVFGEAAKQKARELTSEPLQVVASTRIGLDVDAAFAYVTDASRLGEWIPVPAKTSADDSKAERPGGVGSVRVVRTGPMPPTLEVVKYFEAPRFYAYSANDASLFGMMTNHLSLIGFEAHPEGGTVVTWIAHGRPARSYVLRYLGIRVFQYVLRQGLANLAKRFPVGG